MASAPIESVVGRLVERGAEAVVMTGSRARGEATPESDIDLVALTTSRVAEANSLELRHGQLVSVTWRTIGDERAAFADPGRVGAVVPAWRSARILHDPADLAAGLEADARAWSWDVLGARCDQWVAHQVTGYAEEVHKLVGARRRADRVAEATQRAILALRLAPIMAVARRLLYETENRLWTMVNAAMGPTWTAAQERALGVSGSSAADASDAALELYRLAAADAQPYLDSTQRDVVARAVALEDAAATPGRRRAVRGDGIGFVGFRTDRFDEMAALFRDRIGLEIVHEAPGAARFALGADGELHVYADTDLDHAFFTTGPVVGLRVADVDAIRAALEADGLEMLTDVERSETAAWCHFRAPDGTVLEIIGPS